MPLDPSFVGRTYPPTPPYEVGREKIREFADAVGAKDPVHRDLAEARARGYADLVAPPTFPIVFTLVAGRQIVDDPQLGIDYSRVVHGQQRFRYARPVHAGDRLTCVAVIEDLVSRGGHDFVTTRTDVATVTGEPVVTVWSKLVVRGEG
jgi:acyl dehydratase